MLPVKYDLQLYRGDYYQKEFRFYDLDENNNKIPSNLNGVVAVAQVRDSTDFNAALIINFSVGIIDNVITITTTPVQTQNIEAGSYVWDLQVGDVTKLYGKIKIIGDVSHD